MPVIVFNGVKTLLPIGERSIPLPYFIGFVGLMLAIEIAVVLEVQKNAHKAALKVKESDSDPSLQPNH